MIDEEIANREASIRAFLYSCAKPSLIRAEVKCTLTSRGQIIIISLRFFVSSGTKEKAFQKKLKLTDLYEDMGCLGVTIERAIYLRLKDVPLISGLFEWPKGKVRFPGDYKPKRRRRVRRPLSM